MEKTSFHGSKEVTKLISEESFKEIIQKDKKQSKEYIQNGLNFFMIQSNTHNIMKFLLLNPTC